MDQPQTICFGNPFCAVLLVAGTLLFPAAAADHPEPIDPALASSVRAWMPLEEGWADPPPMARTRVWWWWLNGNVTRKAITRDLAAMKAQGIGGANIIDAAGDNQHGNRRVPHGPDFATPEWRALFRHAVAEADRFGLELGFNIQSGWNLGGPGVSLEDASKRLTFSERTIEGGAAISVQLPQPPARDDFYRDVAVVAFPVSRAPEAPEFEVKASSQQSGHPASLAADGRPDTFWVSGGEQPGQGPRPDQPAWLEVEFQESVRVDRVRLVPRPDYGPKVVRVEIPGNDGRWRVVCEAEDLSRDPVNLELGSGPVQTKSVRLTILGAHDPRFPDRPRNAQVAEFICLEGRRVLNRKETGLPRISNFEQKAYYRYPGPFTATEAWHLLEAGEEMGRACGVSDVVDLSGQLGAGGLLSWQAPAGVWKVLRFGYTFSGAHTSTESEGWHGRCIDYLDRETLDRYWESVLTPIFEEVRPYLGKSLRYLHTDSWELGPVNWTARMPARFQALRRYEITPWLPALAGYVVESAEASTRFLNDFRRTLADLIADNKYTRFSERAHALGLGIHPESGGPHAGPFDALRNLGLSDVPMGEFWARSKTHRVADHQRLFVKQTASAAHVYGRRVALAESFTSIGPQWERDPRALKPVFDRAACEGHNLTMWHTFDCSPEEMGMPGQAYFAGTHFNPQITWWPQAGAFVGYMNRCHFLLQQGVPVSDVLYFYGENIPSFVRLKRDDPAQVLPGYDYDVIDRWALLHRTRVVDGQIALPDGARYTLLALPRHDAISLEVLQHIARLAGQGATVVGRLPKQPYGLEPQAPARTAFSALVRALRQERRIRDVPVRESLAQLGREPDFTFRNASPASENSGHETSVDYIHRRTDHADIYFVVNRLDQPRKFTGSFRITGKQPELWDPVTGEIRLATRFSQAERRTELDVALPPNGALFVLFRKPAAPDAGRGQPNDAEWKPLRQIQGPWQVQFDPSWGPKSPVTFARLTSWSESNVPEIKYYSGAAVYSVAFNYQGGLTNRVRLDLGELKNVAAIRLNGRDLGVVWTWPFAREVTGALRRGTNRLEVTVVNLWPNRLIGDQRQPEAQRRTRTNVTKFEDPRNQELLPSGLFGPVLLHQVAAE